ncbi:MAG: hypothetical protein QM747_13425 [Nocardioides sp.]
MSEAFAKVIWNNMDLGVLPIEPGQRDHTLGLRDLAPVLLAVRFLATGTRRLVGRGEVLVDEIPSAFEVFEDAQVVVGGVPRVRDEQSNWIVL